MTEPMSAPEPSARQEIVLADRVVPGGFFLPRADRRARTPFAPTGFDRQASLRHCCTYAGGGSSILDELLSIVDNAREKVFVATLYLGDSTSERALLRTVDRLHGGVYVISALDDKGIDDAVNKVDDSTDIERQTEYRYFRQLTRRGIYVRGYPGLHAKFVVADDRVALVSSANLVTRSFHQIGENGLS